MKRKSYNIIYAVIMVVILSLLLFLPNLSDGWQMMFGALAIILTSIFTYSNRHDLPRKRRQEDDS